jgi:hypothetical protein
MLAISDGIGAVFIRLQSSLAEIFVLERDIGKYGDLLAMHILMGSPSGNKMANSAVARTSDDEELAACHNTTLRSYRTISFPARPQRQHAHAHAAEAKMLAPSAPARLRLRDR